MSFTYDIGSSVQSTFLISRVRLALGDVVQGSGVRPDGSNLGDAEILQYLSENSNNVYLAANLAAQDLAGIWTNVANISIGPRAEHADTIAKKWSDRAKEFAAQGVVGKMYVGGLSHDHMTDVEQDGDRVAPAFTRRMLDHPETSRP